MDVGATHRPDANARPAHDNVHGARNRQARGAPFSFVPSRVIRETRRCRNGLELLLHAHRPKAGDVRPLVFVMVHGAVIGTGSRNG